MYSKLKIIPCYSSGLTVDISLPQYIGNYIETEVERLHPRPAFDIKFPGDQSALRHWIEEAINAYEGGAR